MASVTSANRLTGLATGQDIDSMVKTQMSSYQNKIDTMKQQKEVTEIRQKLYRDLLTETRSFYNKYLDPLSKDNLLLSTNYKSVEFKSSNSNIVTATASSTAKLGNYTITGTAPTAAKITIDDSSDKVKDGEKIIINHKEFTLKGSTKAEIAKNLNTALEEAGLSVKARYTDFAGINDTANNSVINKSALILEATELGSKAELEIGGDILIGDTTKGTNGTKAVVEGINVQELKSNSWVIKVGENELKLENLDNNSSYDSITTKINEELDKLTDPDCKFKVSKIDDDGRITFEAKSEGNNISDPEITIGTQKGSFVSGTDATKTITKIKKSELEGLTKLNVNGTDISISGKNTTLQQLEDQLKNSQLSVMIDEDYIIIENNISGENENVEVKKANTGWCLSFRQQRSKFGERCKFNYN